MSWFDGRERWAYLGLAYALLAASTVGAALLDVPDGGPSALRALLDPLTTRLSGLLGAGSPVDSADRASLPWPALTVAAALWLAPIAWLHPRRDALRAPVIGHYLVLIALAGALAAENAAFTVFASVGYPLAISLLPARLIMAGVTLTAAVNVAAQASPGDRPALLAVIAGVAVPLVLAGWYVSAEHDKRRRLVERLRTAMDENADLHARLLDQARRAGVLDERHRMAGEIHDTVAQDLVALIGQLDAARRAVRDPAPLRHLDQAAELARRGLAEARRSVRALRPEPLEDARLPEALGRMAASWSRT